MPTRPVVAVLLNPRSSRAVRGEIDGAQIEAWLGDSVEVRVRALEDGDDIERLAAQAVHDGAATVVAAGGDGTVSAVAAALVGTDVALGILPLGTSNSIGEALGIPPDPAAACAVIRDGRRRAVDTAYIGDRSMLLMATIGLHARAVTEATPEAKARLGVIAYVGKALEVLLDQEPFMVDLEFVEGPSVRMNAHAVTVANLVPARAVLAQGPPEVVPDDGLLDVTVVAFTGALDALATSMHLYARALTGLPAERDGVAFTQVAKLTIHAEPEQQLMIDGEHCGCTPFTVECRPRSLQVLV